MTHNVVIGIDPGISGAIAVLADFRCTRVFDMPKARRRVKGEQVNAHELFAILRGTLSEHSGAYCIVVVEEVASRPGQGVASMFRFGESAGVVRGVVASLGVPCAWVQPQVWKRDCALIGAAKEASAARAVELHPEALPLITRKRDCGRADALLIARYGWRQCIGNVRTAA